MSVKGLRRSVTKGKVIELYTHFGNLSIERRGRKRKDA